jgi:DNA/RNA-binding domain of Phe-tRNA-synthetase-like protein
MAQTLTFQYHPDILPRFPNIRGGVILAEALSNQPSPPDLQDAFLAEQRLVLARIGDTPLSEIPSLAAWRGAFRDFGVDPTKYRSAAEALLRRLTKKGDIPSINAIVDLCNLVSIRYALPVAAFDMRALGGSITVHFAAGTEQFKPLGEDQAENPEEGEVIFSSGTGLVVARRWCWRQSEESAAQSDTPQAILTVESQHPGGQVEVEAAVRDLTALLSQYAGGSFITGVVGPAQAKIEG